MQKSGFYLSCLLISSISYLGCTGNISNIQPNIPTPQIREKGGSCDSYTDEIRKGISRLNSELSRGEGDRFTSILILMAEHEIYDAERNGRCIGIERVDKGNLDFKIIRMK